MNFTLTEEQRMAADLARQVLGDHCTSAALRKHMAADARDNVLWQTVAEAGLAGALAPERAGGLALGEVDFALIAEACGYAAMPEPLIDHAGIAIPLLAATEADETLVREATVGNAALAVGHAINPFVVDADRATALLLQHGDEVHLVRHGNSRLTREPSIDPFRRLFRVDWSPSSATRIADARGGQPLWQDALDRGALFTAAECLGLAQRAVDLSVAHARERKQFGKPIGSYQAVKHLLATVQVKIEFARPVVQAAAAQFAARDAMSRARISHAKLVAVEAADLGVRSALQVHGAMGYSWEVDVHFFLKRALALTYAWGEPAFHRARVDARVFGQPLGPEHTFAREHSNA